MCHVVLYEVFFFCFLNVAHFIGKALLSERCVSRCVSEGQRAGWSALSRPLWAPRGILAPPSHWRVGQGAGPRGEGRGVEWEHRGAPQGLLGPAPAFRQAKQLYCHFIEKITKELRPLLAASSSQVRKGAVGSEEAFQS